MALLAAALVLAARLTPSAQPDAAIADLVTRLTRDAAWKQVRQVPLPFRTYHPQGLVRVGDALVMSAVEVARPTRRFPAPQGRHDRDTGEGVGHLFRFTLSGELLARATIGEGSMYHPGGLDFDGRHVWVAVAEYRPDSRSIVYRVDPQTLKAQEVMRVDDHLGALVHDAPSRTLTGASWGSRRLYRWALRGDGALDHSLVPGTGVRNPSHYVDYQDCKAAGTHLMLCTGVATLRGASGTAAVRLGGLDLIDTRDGRALHQVPVPLWTSGGLPMTQNPAWVEPLGRAPGLRAYFVPEDDRSTVYVYEVELP